MKGSPFVSAAAIVVACLTASGSASSAARDVILRVAAAAPPAGYSNPYNTLPTAIAQVPAAVLDPLLRLGADGALEPVLALSWRSVGPTTWRFDLRPNVKFSNGETFDAAAVKATIDYLRSPAAAGLLIANEVRGVSAVRVVDPLTVEIETARIDAVLPKRLSIVYMVPPRLFADVGIEGFSRAPVGTGPYVLKEWGDTSGRSIIEANPTAWTRPRQIGRVEVFHLKEPVSRVQALTSGQIDLAYAINHDDLPLLREAGFQVVVKQESQVLALALRNVGNEGRPLHDVRVRQALNFAVDKQSIVDGIYDGLAQATGQGAIAGVTGYNPDVAPYPYDPARARALLAEAGHGRGFDIDARIVTGQYVGDAAVYQKVAADLAAVGVRLRLNTVLPQEWIRMYTSGDWSQSEAISISWQSAVYNDLIRAVEPFSCRRPGAFFCAPEIEPLIDASNANLDPDGREKQLQAIAALLHDAAPTIFLNNLSTVFAASPRVREIVATRSGFRFERMTVAGDGGT